MKFPPMPPRMRDALVDALKTASTDNDLKAARAAFDAYVASLLKTDDKQTNDPERS